MGKEDKKHNTYLSTDDDGHHNFTSTIGVTGNMAREFRDVGDNDRLLAGGGGTTDSLSEANLLARGLTVEGAQQ